MKWHDPINGQLMEIKSVVFPSKTLLQGKEYKRTNEVLTPRSVPPVALKPVKIGEKHGNR